MARHCRQAVASQLTPSTQLYQLRLKTRPPHSQGPPRPMPGGGSAEGVQAGLHSLLDGFAEAPFTLQRLCEVLLEPRKQYSRLDKLVRPAGAGGAEAGGWWRVCGMEERGLCPRVPS